MGVAIIKTTQHEVATKIYCPNQVIDKTSYNYYYCL